MNKGSISILSNQYSNLIFSHPETKLIDHLKQVKDESIRLISKKKVSVSLPTNILQEIMSIIAISHDIAKGTKYFQEYLKASALNDQKKVRELKSKKLQTHGHLSSIFTFYFLYKYSQKLSIEDFNKEQTAILQLIPYIGYMCVKRHHGDLKDIMDELSITRSRKKLLLKQIDNFHPEIEEMIIKIESEIHLDVTLDEFKELYEDIIYTIEICNVYTNLENIDQFHLYFLTLFFYSVLTDADKTSAIGIEKPQLDMIPGNIIDMYKVNKFADSKVKEDEINKIRNKIYTEAIQNITKTDLDTKIFTLTAPTGTGKTLAALSSAFKLQERLKREKKQESQIFYCLPFLSIIDQNAEVIEEVLRNCLSREKVDITEEVDLKAKSKNKKTLIPTSTFLVHHHLADVLYTTDEEKYDINSSQYLIEDWHSKIVISTFVQLFHSFFTNKNKASRKFHNIANSIIILDEIQALPHKYWSLVREGFRRFSKEYNVYVILTTATQPWLFNSANMKKKELVDSKEEIFQLMNRIELHLHTEKIFLDEFITEIKQKTKQEEKDVLIVVNTIRQAQEVFKELKKKPGTRELYYLSSKLIPKKRMERIRKISKRLEQNNKKRKKGKNTPGIIIVSTQLIEAGVDIDVDIILRDFAPLDSINQVAGRCNRNGRKEEKGQVYLYEIVDDKTKRSFSSYIYDGFLLSKTKSILKGKTKIDEKEFLNVLNEYYKELAVVGHTEESEAIVNAIDYLQFSKIATFQLIEHTYPTAAVFLEYDEETVRIWKEYESLWNIKDWKERNNKYLQIKKDIYVNLITVNKKELDRVAKIKGYYYIPKKDKDQFYDEQIGFRITDNEGAFMF